MREPCSRFPKSRSILGRRANQPTTPAESSTQKTTRIPDRTVAASKPAAQPQHETVQSPNASTEPALDSAARPDTTSAAVRPQGELPAKGRGHARATHAVGHGNGRRCTRGGERVPHVVQSSPMARRRAACLARGLGGAADRVDPPHSQRSGFSGRVRASCVAAGARGSHVHDRFRPRSRMARRTATASGDGQRRAVEWIVARRRIRSSPAGLALRAKHGVRRCSSDDHRHPAGNSNSE